jgi:hypothetical protein
VLVRDNREETADERSVEPRLTRSSSGRVSVLWAVIDDDYSKVAVEDAFAFDFGSVVARRVEDQGLRRRRRAVAGLDAGGRIASIDEGRHRLLCAEASDEGDEGLRAQRPSLLAGCATGRTRTDTV